MKPVVESIEDFKARIAEIINDNSEHISGAHKPHPAVGAQKASDQTEVLKGAVWAGNTPPPSESVGRVGLFSFSSGASPLLFYSHRCGVRGTDHPIGALRPNRADTHW